MRTKGRQGRNAVRLFIVAVTLFVLAFAFNASVAPAAGVMSAEGAVGIAMTADTMAPIGAVAPAAARPTALGTYSLMTGRINYVLPILAADTIRAPSSMAGAATTSKVIGMVQAFDTTRTAAAIRGTPTTTSGTGNFAITDMTYGLGIAFILVLTIGAAWHFTRRTGLSFSRSTTIGALALAGGPQARQIALTADPAQKADRRHPETDHQREPRHRLDDLIRPLLLLFFD